MRKKAMLEFSEKLTFVAAVALAVVTLGGSSPVLGPEPIRCAPCTHQKLNDCPAVPADCKQVLREPGCGCCMACALEKGVSCGVHTAHCGEGLRCTPRPGETRPLHALTRGQGVCTEDKGQEAGDEVQEHGLEHYLLALNLPSDHQDTDEGHESLKARVDAIRNKLVQQGPCHVELHAALDMIASSQQQLGDKFTTFYLPNCDKHGYYKAKQVIGFCFSVSRLWLARLFTAGVFLLGMGRSCQDPVTFLLMRCAIKNSLSNT